MLCEIVDPFSICYILAYGHHLYQADVSYLSNPSGDKT